MSLVSLNHYNRSYFYPDDQTQENLSDIKRLHFDENEFQSMITETLKKRKSENIDIQQISRQTKISNKNLRLIEQLKFDALPPMPVKKAFILQYCKVVKNLTRL